MTIPTHTLEADGVMLSFGDRQVLRGVWARIETGRVTGLVGRNGCGKSSLMKILYGSLGPPRGLAFGSQRVVGGSVRLDGEWVGEPYRHGVGYVPQHPFLPGGRRVGSVMRDCGLDFGRLAELFPALGAVAGKRVSSLSGGERRVLEVCTVLASPDVRFCLLDEPFSQLSPLYVTILKNMITEAARTGRKGILVADHRWKEVLDIADEVYMIRAGVIERVADTGDLLRRG